MLTSARGILPKRLLLALCFFLGSGWQSHARTSVVVYRNAKEILAAVDSKKIALDGSVEVVCKISRVGSVFWALSGVSSHDYERIITIVHGDSKNIRDTVEEFRKVAPSLMEAAFQKMRSKSPRAYHKLMDSGNRETDFTFWGMEGTTPVVEIVGFNMEESGERIKVLVGGPTIYDRPTCPPPDVVCGAATGYFDAIDSYKAQHPQWGIDLTNDVRRFVQLEIDEAPANVGPPIRVLRIDSKGPRWIQHGEGCELGDIPKQSKRKENKPGERGGGSTLP